MYLVEDKSDVRAYTKISRARKFFVRAMKRNLTIQKVSRSLWRGHMPLQLYCIYLTPTFQGHIEIVNRVDRKRDKI